MDSIQTTIENATLDLKTIENFVNLPEGSDVRPRLLPSVDVGTLAGIRQAIFETGGLPATPFATKAAMSSSSLIDDSYAMVTDDSIAANNGLYQKRTGVWVKSSYDPLAQAKTYTDIYGIFATAVAASDFLAEKITRVTTYLNGSQRGTTPTSSADSYVYVMAVEPSTEYTLYTKNNSNTLILLEYGVKPNDWSEDNTSIVGATVNPLIVASQGRYHTFTTNPQTKFLVYNPYEYTNSNFVLIKGTYNTANWAALNNVRFDKPMSLKNLSAEAINSPTLERQKNIVSDYFYGLSANLRAEIGVTAAGARYELHTKTDPLRKKAVSVFAAVKPNTTYTISKETSDRFVVVLFNAADTQGRTILRDASKNAFTFTTESTDAKLFIYLSYDYQKPKVQVELGSKVTTYETAGYSLQNGSVSGLSKLTDIKKETDNTYINLGYQTDKYAYPFENNAHTTATVLDNFYEPLLADFPKAVTKNVLGKDSSGLYDIIEYVFEPDNYEQTIVLTSGMHPTEEVPPFALGILMNEIYRNPSKHEGLAYLRNKVKIVVIPVVSPWGRNQNPKVMPKHYLNFNGVNPNRNFPARWESIVNNTTYDSKGTAPLSEPETICVFNVLNREKDAAAFYLDLHTGEGWVRDAMLYYLDKDDFLRPVIDQVVSMQNDIVRTTLGREPVNEVQETNRTLSLYYAWSVLGIPSSTVEYGTGKSVSLSSVQTTFFTNQIFNVIHYALKADLKNKRLQAERNEQNKPFISLYNTLDGHNNIINTAWTYTKWQTELYNKLPLTRTVMGVASGTYELVRYTHAPVGYKNTVVLSAGRNGNRKAVTELAFLAYKLMTDKNPQIVALRDSTRFIFIPCVNPHGFDNATDNNANSALPFSSFATSTQPESVILRGFIDAGGIDLYVDLDSAQNTYKPAGYADCQVVYNAKADISYQSIFSLLSNKYAVTSPANAKAFTNLAPRSELATYINGKNIAYEYVYINQNVLPKRTIKEGTYVDYGYEADELAYCSEVIFNSIKAINDRIALAKYFAV